MKKLLQLLSVALLAFAAASCSQGAAAIDKAYEQACEASSAEKIATTLCNGDIKVSTLTSEQYAKLGAILEYLTFTGMYSADFEAQMDMYQFGHLLRDYKAHSQTAQERNMIDEYTRDILVNAPGSIPPPPLCPAPDSSEACAPDSVATPAE